MPSYPTFDRNPLDLADEAAAAGQARSRLRRRRARRRPAPVRRRGPRRPGELPAGADGVAGEPARLLGQGQRVLPASTCSAPTTPSGRPRHRRRPRPQRRDLARRGPRGQARPAGRARLPDDLHHAVLRRRAAGGHLVREARPRHHRHAPVRARVQPGDRAAVADPHGLRHLRTTLAERSAELAATHLGVRTDVVAVPLPRHPDELAIPHGASATGGRASASPCPGRTMPKLVVVERDYPARSPSRWRRSGPLVDNLGTDVKGVTSTSGPVELPARQNGAVARRPRRRPAAAGPRHRRVRGDPRAVRDHERARSPSRASSSSRSAPARGSPTSPRARGQADHLRRHAVPAAAGHHVTGVVRQRARRTSLLAVHDQRRAAQAVAHPDRPPALLPRPRLDDRAGRAAPGLTGRR